MGQLKWDSSGGFDTEIKTWDKVAGKYQVSKHALRLGFKSCKNRTKHNGERYLMAVSFLKLNRSSASRFMEVKYEYDIVVDQTFCRHLQVYI